MQSSWILRVKGELSCHKRAWWCVLELCNMVPLSEGWKVPLRMYHTQGLTWCHWEEGKKQWRTWLSCEMCAVILETRVWWGNCTSQVSSVSDTGADVVWLVEGGEMQMQDTYLLSELLENQFMPVLTLNMNIVYFISEYLSEMSCWWHFASNYHSNFQHCELHVC